MINFVFRLKNVATMFACFAVKRMALVAFVLLVSLPTFAQEGGGQKGQMSAGARLTIGSGDDYTNVGIGGIFRFNVTDPLRLEGGYTFFLKKDHFSMWDLSANAHWLLPVTEEVTVYPLAGFSIMALSAGGTSLSESGLNFGAGGDYSINEQLSLNFELRYRVSIGDLELNRLGISLGATFKF